MNYKCGEKPGKGIYICKNCGAKKESDDNTDALAPCSACHRCEYTKA